MKNVRLLPVLIAVSMLSFAVKLGDVMTGFDHMSGAAVAADKPKEETKPADKETKKDDKVDAKAEANPASNTQGGEDEKAADTPEAKKQWPDPGEMDPELATVRNNLLKDLATRREQIEAQAKDLATREAVLKAAEAELDHKYKEMTDLRGQLQNLLNQQSEEEAARLKSLVSIYEAMKPADAARIFNTLDTTILLDVVTRMSEKKTAPILAAMDADRARTLTLLMAQQKQLPDLPDLTTQTPAP